MWWRELVCVLCVMQVACGGPYQLPGDVAPSHYDVRFVFDLDPNTNFIFYGAVKISLTVKNSTSKIVLHAQKFNISNDKIEVSGPDNPAVTSVQLNPMYNFLTIEVNKTLKENGNYTLTIPFFGTLDESVNGVFVSSYVTANQTTEYLVVTQFESIAARKGFPCFDEPSYKATFRLNIGHHKDYRAISNMASKYISTSNKSVSSFVWTQFDNSMPMSTYLVAFTVSKFSHVQSPSNLSRTTICTWSRRDALNQASYAATFAPKVLSYYESYFNVSYPMPKLDMVALPEFGFGSMENWGMITYVENLLLFDTKQSSSLNQETIAETIAHELSHQWFGDLVTMSWWSDLWLNEGFATYIASMGVTAVEPSWGTENNFAVDNMLSILAKDALPSSHPVSVQIDDPRRIPEFFDAIAYYKGSLVIRMLINFLGENVFKNGINKYLTNFSYGNVQQDNLWAEMTVAAAQYQILEQGVTVKDVMDTWTRQSGYPLLTVERNYSDGSLTVTQKRFLLLDTNSTTSVSWWVPMTILLESKKVDPKAMPVQWLAVNEGVASPRKIQLKNSSANQWLLFNTNMIVPCRVNYDVKNWQLLIKALNSHHENIPEMSRVQLIGDAFALAWTNELDYSIAIQLVNYLQKEQKYLPLYSAINNIAKIDNAMKRTADYGLFQSFVNTLIDAKYKQIGGISKKFQPNGQNLNNIKIQVLTSDWACRMSMAHCETTALHLLDKWMAEEDPDNNNPIPLDVRPTVYCTAVRRGGLQYWKFLLKRKRSANVDSARTVLLEALACSQDVWLLKQCLEWCVDGSDELEPQDVSRMIEAVMRSPTGYYVARDFIYDRIGDIYKALHDLPRRLGFIFRVLLNQFNTQTELDQFLTWREQNKNYLQNVQLAVQMAIEKATVNMAWVKNNRRSFVEQLNEFNTESR